MLVSSIAQFDAINRRDNAAMAMLYSQNRLMSLAGKARAFAGEHSLDMLHQMDNRLSLDLISNALLYKIAILEEKMLKKMQADELKSAKKSVDYFA